jgi:thiosulfate/3-mercaptopyruvate sulfurtransferase
MRYTTLVSTDTLQALLTDPHVVVIDCRFDLADPAAGECLYIDQHVPGAVYAHLDRDLSGPKTGRNGRHPLPEPGALGDTFSNLGIDRRSQVIAYDQDSGMFASRLWWMLRWLEHDAVAVLDGGFSRWLTEHRPTRSGAEMRPRRAFVAQPRPEMIASLTDVQAVLGLAGWRLLDARAPERFRGDVEPIDRVGGHIPGAVNHHFTRNLGDDGRFKSAEELRDGLREAVGAVSPRQIVSYCGSGVTACQNLLALEHAGMTGARLYPGSWSEWSSDPGRPTETGPARPFHAGA